MCVCVCGVELRQRACCCGTMPCTEHVQLQSMSVDGWISVSPPPHPAPLACMVWMHGGGPPDAFVRSVHLPPFAFGYA